MIQSRWTLTCMVIGLAWALGGCSTADRPFLVLYRLPGWVAEPEKQNFGLDVAVWRDGRVIRRKDPQYQEYVRGSLSAGEIRALDELIRKTRIAELRETGAILDAGGYGIEYRRGWRGKEIWQLDDEPKPDSPPGILRSWLFSAELTGEATTSQGPVVPEEWMAR